MVERHQKLRLYYNRVNLEYVSKMLLTAREEADVGALNLQLKDLQSVTVELQNEFKSLSDCKNLFGGILKIFPEHLDRLSMSKKFV